MKYIILLILLPFTSIGQNFFWSHSPIRKCVDIGASYEGGIVAYVFVQGDPGYVAGQCHGLIAAPGDYGSGIYWSTTALVTSATGTALGTGNANTDAIVATHGAGTYAAKYCSDLVLGGKSDWYLPSKDELAKIWINRNAIGGFDPTYNYWSSSEFNKTAAWFVGFGSGTPGTLSKVTYTLTRAVRSF